MKKLTFYFIILLLATGLGLTIHQYPAHVLITWGQTQIQTTLWFAILAIFVIIFIFHQLRRLLKGTYNLPTRYYEWFKKRHDTKRQNLFNQGFFLFLTDLWDEASTILNKLTQQKNPSLLYYVTLAKIAHHKKDYENINYYLSKAKTLATPKEILTLDILHARWQREIGQCEQALTLLNKLKISHPNNPQILKELSQVYTEMKDWKGLREMLSELRHYARLKPIEFQEIEKNVFISLLSEAMRSNEAELLENTWKSIPKYLRHTTNFITLYISGLIQNNQHDKAEKILKKNLEQRWESQLIAQYAIIQSPNPAKQLSRAESWLKTHPNDPDLLFCLGQLCKRHRLWGKAKSYLESAFQKKPEAEIYAVLAKVLEHLGRKASSNRSAM